MTQFMDSKADGYWCFSPIWAIANSADINIHTLRHREHEYTFLLDMYGSICNVQKHSMRVH